MKNFQDRFNSRIYTHTNRFICTVLEEMRKCDLTKNYSFLSSLIEEAQTLANRMESALDEYSETVDNLPKLKSEIKNHKKYVEKKDTQLRAIYSELEEIYESVPESLKKKIDDFSEVKEEDASEPNYDID